MEGRAVGEDAQDGAHNGAPGKCGFESGADLGVWRVEDAEGDARVE